MFYSIKESGSAFNHDIYREDCKIANDLTFKDSFKVLSAHMLDYDTMQVQYTNGSWCPTVWKGDEVKKHYDYLTGQDEDTVLEY